MLVLTNVSLACLDIAQTRHIKRFILKFSLAQAQKKVQKQWGTLILIQPKIPQLIHLSNTSHTYVFLRCMLTDISFVYQIIIIYIHTNVNKTSKITLLQWNQLLHALKLLHWKCFSLLRVLGIKNLINFLNRMHIFWCNVKDDDKDNNTEINKCRKGIIMY